jgi:hypothetical protein
MNDDQGTFGHSRGRKLGDIRPLRRAFQELPPELQDQRPGGRMFRGSRIWLRIAIHQKRYVYNVDARPSRVISGVNHEAGVKNSLVARLCIVCIIIRAG